MPPSKYAQNEKKLLCGAQGADVKTSLSIVIIRYSAMSCLLCPRDRISLKECRFFCNSAPAENMESSPDEKRAPQLFRAINQKICTLIICYHFLFTLRGGGVINYNSFSWLCIVSLLSFNTNTLCLMKKEKLDKSQ